MDHKTAVFSGSTNAKPFTHKIDYSGHQLFSHRIQDIFVSNLVLNSGNMEAVSLSLQRAFCGLFN